MSGVATTTAVSRMPVECYCNGSTFELEKALHLQCRSRLCRTAVDGAPHFPQIPCLNPGGAKLESWNALRFNGQRSDNDDWPTYRYPEETAIEDDEVGERKDCGRHALWTAARNEVGPCPSPREDGRQHFHKFCRRMMRPGIQVFAAMHKAAR